MLIFKDELESPGGSDRKNSGARLLRSGFHAHRLSYLCCRSPDDGLAGGEQARGAAYQSRFFNPRAGIFFDANSVLAVPASAGTLQQAIERLRP